MFAAELEVDDLAFYEAAAANPACAQHKGLFEQFAADMKKNEQLMRRTCRESVCEMILEPIVDFTRGPFLSERHGVQTMTWDQVLAKALELETKAERFYTEAALKTNALPEVSRALARTATRRADHRKQLESLAGA
jgi:rubrerythrin